ncbi:MAG TPA: glycosyltransferase [Pirellulales bacterium]|jgi:glycosyltransferase involved in cell wall biosynthesis
MASPALVETPPQVLLADRAGDRPTVCQLVHALNVGGAELLAAGFARNLQDRYRFILVCLEELGTLGEQLRHEGFTVYTLGRRDGIDVACMRKLAGIWRSERVQLIHAHQYTPFFYALGSGMFRRRPPVLFTEHGRWFPDYPRRKRIVFNRLMLRKRDRVIGVGGSVRQALIENEGLHPDRVGTIYNGVSLAAFSQAPADAGARSAVRRELAIGDDDFLLVQVARLDALKDHCTAVRTMEHVVKSCPNAKLVLVGVGDQREKIAAEIRARGLEQVVRLVGLRHDVPRLLHAADLFLLTSVSEGIPLTIIEAMATGLPVVSTAVGGVAEVVDDQATGLLAPSGDDEQLAAAAIRLIQSPPLRKQFGEAGCRRATNLFSESQMNASYRQLYGEMLHEIDSHR